MPVRVGPADDRNPAMVAGYRVVRTLSSTERADILLGHAEHGTAPATVAIKVFRAGVEPESVGHEIAAMDGAAGLFLPGLLDLSTLPDGRVALVMERLSGETIGSVLARRGRVEPGEAVTMLAPMVVALGAVHSRGFVHARLGQATVTFDHDGRPVLTGLGALRPLPPYGVRDASDAASGDGRLDLIRADYARLTSLMRSVFDRLDNGSTAARQGQFIAAWFEGATSAVPFTPCLEELERRLFEWATPMPVHLSPDTPPGPAPVPGRIQLSEFPAEMPLGGGSPLLEDDSAGPLAAGPAVAPVAALARVRARLGARLAGKRSLVIVGAAVAVTVSALGLTVLPQRSEAPSAGGDHPVVSAHPSAPGPAATGTPEGAAALPDADHTTAVTGDDPAAAVPHLLAARAACIASTSVDCLAATNQAGSPLLAADIHAIELGRQGGKAPHAADYAGHTATLVERSGNSALLVLSPGEHDAQNKPASLLVVKGEAGWRLREFFEAMDHPG